MHPYSRPGNPEEGCTRLANKYLVEGELNVSETAWEVGYTNVSHFIRSYKKQHGVNPGDVSRSSKTA
ncbi:helix-turn-helix domain-containing protein [Desulfoluna spongiiphila]|uniref:helix-turn-helix domain-containing protein n=1 Tax=Desulfoluna spongiiphila TaxID=419481 RepID=UPI000B883E81